MKIVDKFSSLRWRNMGFGKVEIGDYILGMVQDRDSKKTQQVVMQVVDEIDKRQDAHILVKIGVE